MKASNNRIEANQEKQTQPVTANHYKHGAIEAKLVSIDYDTTHDFNDLDSKGPEAFIGKKPDKSPVLKCQAIVFRDLKVKEIKSYWIVSIYYEGIDIMPILDVYSDLDLFDSIYHQITALAEHGWNLLPIAADTEMQVSATEWDHEWKIDVGDGLEHNIRMKATVHEASASGIFCTLPEFHEIHLDGQVVNPGDREALGSKYYGDLLDFLSGILASGFCKNLSITKEYLEHDLANSWTLSGHARFFSDTNNSSRTQSITAMPQLGIAA